MHIAVRALQLHLLIKDTVSNCKCKDLHIYVSDLQLMNSALLFIEISTFLFYFIIAEW